MTTKKAPIRVARIIGRLNVGGPAVQAIHLTKELPAVGIETRLFRGRESADEGSMDDLAAELGVRPVRIPAMRRNVGGADGLALLRLVRELRRYRPNIVHTEAAKAGALGRVAALLAFPRSRPVTIHTFHGHSLEGYFAPRTAAAFLAVERFLGKQTTLLIAVSEEVKQDLVRIGVTTPDRIRVVRLGLDLEPFQVHDDQRASMRTAMRRRWDVPTDAKLVTLLARLVPIKRVDRFLRIAVRLADADSGLHFAIVGDGELRAELRNSAPAHQLGGRLHWTGFELDVPSVCFASDCMVLTSDNEGTPASLIEAHAAGLPAVSTRVGGAASVIGDGVTGHLVDPEDEAAFAVAVLDALARGPELGEVGREHVHAHYALDRLVEELGSLYRGLLAAADTDDHSDRHSASSAGDIGPAR